MGREATRAVSGGILTPSTGEGNGTPLQNSCLENPRDGGAWWAAVYGDTGSAPAHSACSLSAHTARALGCSAGNNQTPTKPCTPVSAPIVPLTLTSASAKASLPISAPAPHLYSCTPSLLLLSNLYSCTPSLLLHPNLCSCTPVSTLVILYTLISAPTSL